MIKNNSIANNVHLFMLLRSYRLKWYKMQVHDIFLRYKFGIIIFVALFTPALASIGFFSVEPLLTLLEPSQHLKQKIILLLLIYGSSLGWGFLQRKAIFSKKMEAYNSTLPLSLLMLRLLDITTLIWANNLLLLPMAFATLHLVDICSFIRLAILLGNILAMQLNFLKFNALSVVLTLISGFILLLSSLYSFKEYSHILIVISIIILVIALFMPKKERQLKLNGSIIANYDFFNARFLIHKALIFRELLFSTVLRVMYCIASISIGLYVINATSSENKKTGTILLVMALCTFIIQGMSFQFIAFRNNNGYLNTLPLFKYYWPFLDFMTILFFYCLTVVFFLIGNEFFSSVHNVLILFLAVPGILLLFCMYLAQLKLKKFSSVLSFLLLFGWVLMIIKLTQ